MVLSIGIVSAAEDSGDILTDEYSGDYYFIEENDFTEIQQAIDNANESENYRLTVSNDNILLSMPTFDDTKDTIKYDEEGNIESSSSVEAAEIFTYVVNDRVVLVYQIIR